MFEELFKYRAVVNRHRNAPLDAERERFLRQRQKEGRAPETLVRLARELLCVVTLLEISSTGVTAEQISDAADQWAQKQQQRGRAETDKWSRQLFISVATDWCRFLGYFHEELSVKEPEPFGNELIQFTDWMESERGLSPSTITHYTWYVKDLLRWCGARMAAM